MTSPAPQKRFAGRQRRDSTRNPAQRCCDSTKATPAARNVRSAGPSPMTACSLRGTRTRAFRPRSRSRSRPGTSMPRGALESLRSRVSASGSGAFGAAAVTARGEVALAEQRPVDAVVELRRAWQAWQDVDAPYEGHRARGAARRGPTAPNVMRPPRVVELRVGAVDVRADRRRPGQRKDRRAPAKAAGSLRCERSCSRTSSIRPSSSSSWETSRGRTFSPGTIARSGRASSVMTAKRSTNSATASSSRFPARLRRSSAPLSSSSRSPSTAVTMGSRRKYASVSTPPKRPSARVTTAARACTRPPASRASASANEIVASQATLDGLDDRFTTSAERALQLKGLAEPVLVATVNWR